MSGFYQRSDHWLRNAAHNGQPHHPLTCFVAGRGNGKTVSGEDRKVSGSPSQKGTKLVFEEDRGAVWESALARRTQYLSGISPTEWR